MAVMAWGCDDDDDVAPVPEGRWELRAQYVNPLPNVEEATLFEMGGRIYWGFGKYWDSEAVDWKFNTRFYRLDACGWVSADDEIPEFPGEGRQDAKVVTVDGKVYAGFGYTSITHAFMDEKYFRDWWEYDGKSGLWLQYGERFPTVGRRYAVAFAVDDKVVVGDGQAEDGSVLTDFYYFDVNGVTLCSASSLKMDNGGNKEAAEQIGKLIAERAIAKGIEEVVFDRGGYIYHGRVQALAEGAREGGLKF